MPRTATEPRTARELLALVEPFGPTAEGGELVFATDPPSELVPVLAVLHTAVRALLTRRRWWGAGSDEPRAVELNPSAPIPAGIDLLCVEGHERWDRIHPDARTALPRLFSPR